MGLKWGFIKFSFFILIYIGNDDILSVVYVYERDSVNCFWFWRFIYCWLYLFEY